MSSDLESPEAFVNRMYRDATDSEFKLDEDVVVEMVTARDEAIRADERAKGEAELTAAQNSYTNAKALFDELCEYVAQMCEHFGDKRDEVPCDAWRLRDHVARAVRRIAELDAKEGEGWIAVAERLPERGEFVLVAIEGGDVEPAARDLCGDGWHTLVDVGYHDPTIESVTHWRPLPAPPTAAERKDGAT